MREKFGVIYLLTNMYNSQIVILDLGNVTLCSLGDLIDTFSLYSLEGPILDLFRRQLNIIESERNSLKLKCNSSENQIHLLHEQLQAHEKHRSEYLKRYEEAINDKEKISKDYSDHVTNLQTKCSKLEERCSSILNALELAKRESSDWKSKYTESSSQLKTDENKFRSQLAVLESRISSAEGRLAAAREQAASAQEGASEWKRKYDVAAGEAKSALERAAVAQERTNKKAQAREDTLRAEFAVKLAQKVTYIAYLDDCFFTINTDSMLLLLT